MTDTDKLRPEVREAVATVDFYFNDGAKGTGWPPVRAELVRMADENARLNKIESLATEQRLQMEDVELYLMDVSQPDDEDAPWCDRMKSAIELLIQDCNDAVGQKNKAEAELAAIKARIVAAPTVQLIDQGRAVQQWYVRETDGSSLLALPPTLSGKRVRLVVEE